jgi:hypothetical protein
MNDDLEPFEERLAQQPLKPIPGDWRAEILRETRRHASSIAARPETNWLSTLNQKLSTLLWPHPKAWAGLATVWVLLLLLNFSLRDQKPATVEKISPPSPEVMAELKQQRQLFAELIGPPLATDIDRRKNLAPRPRSECSERFMA